jgi:hypothetical protein
MKSLEVHLYIYIAIFYDLSNVVIFLIMLLN